MKNPEVVHKILDMDLPEETRQYLLQELPEVGTTHVCKTCGYSINIPQDYPGMWVVCPSCGDM